jgi:hypothetical protein
MSAAEWVQVAWLDTADMGCGWELRRVTLAEIWVSANPKKKIK